MRCLRESYDVRNKTVAGDLRMVAVKVNPVFFERLYFFLADDFHAELYFAEKEGERCDEYTVDYECGKPVKNIFSYIVKFFVDLNFASLTYAGEIVVKFICVINGFLFQGGKNSFFENRCRCI